ncbi:MAG TPA: RDD family protein [Niabella sp.]
MSDPNYGYSGGQAGFPGHGDSDLFNDQLLPVQYGSFWERFAAILIDGLIIAVAGAILNSIFGLGFSREMFYQNDTNVIYAAYWKSNTIPFVIQWLYFAFMESSPRQATLGKMALGLKVTSMDGRRITFLNATGRYFAKIISALILLIGYLMVLWDDKRQALHDKLAGTLVIKKG